MSLTNEQSEGNDRLLAFVLFTFYSTERIICYLHLINDGVTVIGDTVTVEWQGTGPTAANRITEFDCRLGNGGFQSCEWT